ncbi:MAG: phenylalanine--tRNA ligase subunit beta [Candidatus Paceibacterota bacterium]
MKISYNWLKSYIPDIPTEEDVANLVTFKLCEIEDVEKLPNGDTIFDFKILPDRAHDLLSHQGVAREIASLLGLDFVLPNYKLSELSKPTELKINIETDGCRRYMGRIVRGIKIGPSPEWMVKYLTSIGQRSINNIVDATNIVMFDCGQPIHAFDLQQLLDGKIVVKQAQKDQKIELVGSEKLTAILDENDIVITDGIKNLAVAGVKGGLNSGVLDKTVDILIEVANFDPTKVRKTARRLSIQTEASKRYENDLSPSLCDFAMNEISALMLEMCPEALFEDVIDIYPTKQEIKKVSFQSDYISKMLGVNIKNEEIEKILKNYKYEFSHTSDMWEVEIPLMRLDLVSSRDFVEEIGRAYGYDKINPTLPPISKSILQDNPIWIKIYLAKQKLVNDGYREVMTYVFRDKGELEVLASASDKNFLKTNLTESLKESISLNQKNLPLLSGDEVKVFEIGTVFSKKGEEIHVAYGDKKNVIELSLDEFVDTSNLLWEKVLPLDVSRQDTEEQKIFKPWSIYPYITRDIAVWVPEGIMPEKLIDIYKDFGTELLIKEPKLFDSFTKPASTQGGDSKTSFAYRLVFQAYDQTLTDEEVNKIMLEITEKIASLGWEVR